MRRGEIWLVGLDPAEGHEQKGRRPVLIVSPEEFNRMTKVPVVLPITSAGTFAALPGSRFPWRAPEQLRPGWSVATSRVRLILLHTKAKSWRAFPTSSRKRCWRGWRPSSSKRHPFYIRSPRYLQSDGKREALRSTSFQNLSQPDGFR